MFIILNFIQNSLFSPFQSKLPFRVHPILPVDKLEFIFEKLSKESSIFLNHEVLRHDFIPDMLPHRENEILRFGEVLAPSLRNLKCSNLFVYGKTGTGKTAVTRYVLNRLSKKSLELGRKINVCYVNCRTVGTEYRVISVMCSVFGVKIPFTGLATAEVLRRFKNSLEASSSPFIVALDEIDVLIRNYGDRMLYALTRINEELKNSKLTIIGISNDLYFKEMLDSRVLSSLSEEEIVFKPYTAEQLKDILLERIKLAFQPGSFPDSTLNLCAALAAAEHGDARRALDLVRVSGEIAERKGAKVVVEEHVYEAKRKIEHDRVFEVLSSLPLHSKILLYVLYTKSFNHEITSGRLYDMYKQFCCKLGVEALTQRRVCGLLNELSMLGVVEAQLVSLGRYGRTKRVKVNVASQTLEKVFLEDPYIGEFLRKNMS